jgi:uncharacterized protein YbjT (DUF2867 family)
MLKVLITGATGNVGMEVLKSLYRIHHQLDLYAGVRNVDTDKTKLPHDNINCVHFDFNDKNTYDAALLGCDILFLLRPPQISDVEKYFKPIIDKCITNKVKQIVFFSVLGVEKSTIIPHHKIEKLIVESKIPFTFLRPAYFMQNFTTSLQKDLVSKKLICLPAGNAIFTLVDVRDIGSAAAIILSDTASHINKSYDLTSKDKLTFKDMASILSRTLGFEIQYKSPDLISFFLAKRKEKTPVMLILVMIMLHYLPRFQQEPSITNCIEQITGKQPVSFEQFATDNSRLLKK